MQEVSLSHVSIEVQGFANKNIGIRRAQNILSGACCGLSTNLLCSHRLAMTRAVRTGALLLALIVLAGYSGGEEISLKRCSSPF